MEVAFTVLDDGDRMLAGLTGQLDMSTAARVRTFLFKCLAEHPAALLVDVSGLLVVDALALNVFTSVVRQAAVWPGTPVLICAPSPAAAALLSHGAYRRLPVFPTVAQAHAALPDRPRTLPSLIDDLLPVRGAARQARDVATEACVRWNLPWLVGPACVITGELVSNGVQHAGTLMTLRLSVSPRYLYVAVRDGSPLEPVLSVDGPPNAIQGRGLRLVDAIAGSWGHLPTDGGKVVWASLSTEERDF